MKLKYGFTILPFQGCLLITTTTWSMWYVTYQEDVTIRIKSFVTNEPQSVKKDNAYSIMEPSTMFWFLYAETCNFGETNPRYRAPKRHANRDMFDDVGRIVRICAQVSNKSRTTPAWQLHHVNPACSVTRHQNSNHNNNKMIMMMIIKKIIVAIMIAITMMALSFDYGYHWRNGCPELNYVYP